MDLSRHYFVSDDLDDLDAVERELESAGLSTPQIHVLSRDNAGVQRHDHLHGVPSFMKRDAVRSALVGAVVGVVLAIAALLVAFMAGWTDTAAGWTPFLFLALILLGFCTWFGGMHGLRLPNRHFERFQRLLDEGRHVLFVDVEPAQQDALRRVIARHPRLEPAGTGTALPSWLLGLRNGTDRWWYWRMWRDV